MQITTATMNAHDLLPTRAPPEADLLPHTLIHDRYEIRSQIRRDERGTVYEALDRQLGKCASLRVFSTAWSQDDSEVERLKRALGSRVDISVPNAIEFYDVRLDTPPYVAVAELRQGATLREQISSRRGLGSSFSIGEVVVLGALLCKTARGLRGAFPLLRLDLRPETILLDSDGGACIFDIGLPPYRSPRAAEKSAATADTVQIAGVLYELLAGEPYRAPSRPRAGVCRPGAASALAQILARELRLGARSSLTSVDALARLLEHARWHDVRRCLKITGFVFLAAVATLGVRQLLPQATQMWSRCWPDTAAVAAVEAARKSAEAAQSAWTSSLGVEQHDRPAAILEAEAKIVQAQGLEAGGDLEKAIEAFKQAESALRAQLQAQQTQEAERQDAALRAAGRAEALWKEFGNRRAAADGRLEQARRELEKHQRPVTATRSPEEIEGSRVNKEAAEKELFLQMEIVEFCAARLYSPTALSELEGRIVSARETLKERRFDASRSRFDQVISDVDRWLKLEESAPSLALIKSQAFEARFAFEQRCEELAAQSGSSLQLDIFGGVPAAEKARQCLEQGNRLATGASSADDLIRAIAAFRQAVEAFRAAGEQGQGRMNAYKASRTKDGLGRTPLHRAAAEALLDEAVRLLEQGAAIDSKDARGCTALHTAAEAGHIGMVGLLIEKGATANLADLHGRLPLHLAAKGGHLDCLERLLASGGSLAARDKSGWSLLHYAAAGGHEALVELLLSRGVDVDARDLGGRTPLHEAAFRGNDPVVRELLSVEANPDLRDSLTGDTPLHHAARDGHRSIFRRLVAKGASLGLPNDADITPLDIVRSQHPALGEELSSLTAGAVQQEKATP